MTLSTDKFFSYSGKLVVVDDIRNDPNVKSLLYVTGCYETPFFSHIHKFFLLNYKFLNY